MASEPQMAEEVERLVVKLARDGVPPSKIGAVLRDQYAVPSVKEVTGKTVKQILKEQGVLPKLPEDLANIIRRAVKLYDHLSKHKKDYKTRRALEIVESRINRLVRYYKRRGELPPDWRYEREKASLLV